MSYILEALKKSDQQRQRGATPTLPTAPLIVTAPKQSFPVFYGLLAAALLCAGIVIGWLRPWQADQSVHVAEPGVVKSAMPISNQEVSNTLPNLSEINSKLEQKLPIQNSTPIARVNPKVNVRKSDIALPVQPVMVAMSEVIPAPTQKKSVAPVEVSESKTIPLAELPLTIQHELPAMTIQLHSYSSKPINSIVSINSRMMKEGESLAPGLVLEQITPDGVILSFKGYRFQRGIW